VNTVLDPARLALSVPQATAMLLRARPDAIFTTGGYVAIPVLMAAAALRIPTVLWEGNVIPGRSVRAVARLATSIAVSFSATCRTLGGRCDVTGTPIRDLRELDRTAARAQFSLAPADRMLLVFGGSQAVRRFNAAVSSALPDLVDRLTLLHVTGDDGYRGALADRERLPVDLRDRYRPFPFLRADMLAALVAADFVVGRAGSSTLAEVTALGVPMMVVPYPHAAGHQRANARVLVEAGGAVLVEDEDFTAASLLTAADILDDPVRHQRMARAARALGRPGAADAVAALVLAAAERRPFPAAADLEARSRAGGPAWQRPMLPAPADADRHRGGDA
jgi:UDP-N-acetylglucosamine--N-acetylmuramyl-(pentapeptide) pyrophosphoryl-undecaprenol N-acetylglucosamine transferase